MQGRDVDRDMLQAQFSLGVVVHVTAQAGAGRISLLAKWTPV